MHTKHKLHRHKHFHHKHRRGLGPDGSVRMGHSGNSRVPVPERLSAVLKFVSEPVNLNLTGGVQFKSWLANGPYDPDPSLGGLTSAYFTELGLAYTNYVCYGSKCKVYVTPNTSADSPPIIGVLPCRSSSTGSLQVPTDFASLVATPGAKWSYTDTFAKPLTVLHNKVLIKDYYDERADGDVDWAGQAPGDLKTLESGSNPANTIYWVVGVYDQDNVAADANVFVSIEIDFFVTFSARTCPIGYANNSLYAILDPTKVGNEVVSVVNEKVKDKQDDITESVMIGKILDKIRGK